MLAVALIYYFLRMMLTFYIVGTSISKTRVAEDFAKRAGLWPSTSEERTTFQEGILHTAQGRAYALETHTLCCQLLVGKCCIDTTVEVVIFGRCQDGMSLEQRPAFVWQIQIGSADFNTLQSRGWGTDFCYLDALPEQGYVA